MVLDRQTDRQNDRYGVYNEESNRDTCALLLFTSWRHRHDIKEFTPIVTKCYNNSTLNPRDVFFSVKVYFAISQTVAVHLSAVPKDMDATQCIVNRTPDGRTDGPDEWQCVGGRPPRDPAASYRYAQFVYRIQTTTADVNDGRLFRASCVRSGAA